MTAHGITIRVSSVGLKNKQCYVAHVQGNWGPEQKGSDYLQHPLTLSDDGRSLICNGCFLKEDEEFKIVVPVRDWNEAYCIYQQRMASDVHVNRRFDFDAQYNTFWLLAETHPAIRPEQWNQNNLYSTFGD